MSKEPQLIEWPMLGGCSFWLKPQTADHVFRIYEFLKSKSEGKKHKPQFTYFQLHKILGIARAQVSKACICLAFHDPQIVRIQAAKWPYRATKSVRTGQKDSFLRIL